MTCFASIGVSQIQGYLARSRRLWGRRGASDMLAYLTDTSGAADRIEERSFETAGEILQGFPGVTVNDDAVDVDSVLNIRGEDPGEVRKAAEALALNIKLHLPAAHVHTTFRVRRRHPRRGRRHSCRNQAVSAVDDRVSPGPSLRRMLLGHGLGGNLGG